MTLVGGGGTGAIATAERISNGVVTTIKVVGGGTGYTSATLVVITPPVSAATRAPSTATATATIGGTLVAVTPTVGGSGYTSPPTVSFSGGAPAAALQPPPTCPTAWSLRSP